MPADLQDRLGGVIPAHPLALGADGGLDLRAQRALSRYYLDAGANGLAVGVHTTQFPLHHDRALLSEVWQVSAEAAGSHGGDPVLVAGLTGDVDDAVAEAEIAASTGYDAALLSPWGMAELSEDALLERARVVGEVLPTIGFYLQDAVGGLRLGRSFWRRLFDLESVVAVKVAAFDRYRTNDVARTLVEHDRWQDVALLTGNDDAIVHDLLTPLRQRVGEGVRTLRVRGGLLGQWAVGTRAAVRLCSAARSVEHSGAVPLDLLATAPDLVEVNAAVFDVAHDFAGCVPGVNEVLRQQGLLTEVRCLGGDRLSPGQVGLIADVRRRFPELLDEDFVAANAADWLG